MDPWLGCSVSWCERGELTDAEHWYRIAADTGNNTAITNLDTLLKKRGELGNRKGFDRS
ncbi:hypothetical protein [Nocardia salmonicida]|uniref:hypothetical protein n=1 Tax=Nocardia salmonicida TaxID=53431 RepID=UPI00378A0F44